MRLWVYLGIMLLFASCDVQTSVQRANEERILIVGNNTEPQSFDPHIASSVSDFKIINATMEGLVRGDSKDDAKYYPGVAEKWERDATAKKWTFYLRKDLEWSDGTPLTAQDFEYAYRRILHPEFGGRYADMLYPIEGAEAYNKGKTQELGICAKDKHTLEIRLHSPMPHLPLLLMHPTWFPVPRHAVEAHGGMLSRTGQWTRPGNAVSNGPFVLTKHRFNDCVEVRKNPHYRNAAKVWLEGVRFLPTVNGFTETRMFFNDKVHITNNVPPEMTAYAKEKAGDAFCQDDYYVTIFYRLNTKREALKDWRVRQALSMAIDRETLVRDVVCGGGQACFGFTPSGAGYQTPHMVTFDPVKARELLAEAGYAEGKNFPVLELMTTSREVQKTMAEAIQGMWKKHLGIYVEIRSCEWTAYKFAQNTMNYDFSSSSWSGDYLDPSSFLDLWGATSGNNNTGWSHPEYERLLQAVRATGDQTQRMQLLAQAESLMLSEAPVIPLYWAKRSYLKRAEVRGWYPLLLDNHLFEDIRLDNNVKEKEVK